MLYANADGVRLYYESAGEGTPLVLQAHHHLTWMPFQVPYFSQFYRVIVFDRRGTGRSDDPPGPWSAVDLARDLRALLDALDIERAIVGGNSLGGIIAAQFGLDYPDRALALVIGNIPPHGWPLADQWIDEQIVAVRAGGPIIVRQARSYEWEEEGPTTAVEGFADSEIGRYLATLRGGVANSPEAAIKALEVLRSWDQRPRYPELHRLDVPVLVVVAGHDMQKTIELAYEWHQQFKDSDYVILPDAHHGAARENPIDWNRAVHGFLQRRGL